MTSLLKNHQAKTLLFFLDFAQLKGSNQSLAIPWEGIAQSPEVYFNTAIYKLIYALKSPEQLKSEPFCIIALYQYFSTIFVSQAFQFHSREASSKEFLDIDGGDSDLDNSLSLPPEMAVSALVIQTPHSNLTATNQCDALLASSASLTLPAPSV